MYFAQFSFYDRLCDDCLAVVGDVFGVTCCGGLGGVTTNLVATPSAASALAVEWRPSWRQRRLSRRRPLWRRPLRRRTTRRAARPAALSLWAPQVNSQIAVISNVGCSLGTDGLCDEFWPSLWRLKQILVFRSDFDLLGSFSVCFVASEHWNSSCFGFFMFPLSLRSVFTALKLELRQLQWIAAKN